MAKVAASMEELIERHRKLTEERKEIDAQLRAMRVEQLEEWVEAHDVVVLGQEVFHRPEAGEQVKLGVIKKFKSKRDGGRTEWWGYSTKTWTVRKAAAFGHPYTEVTESIPIYNQKSKAEAIIRMMTLFDFPSPPDPVMVYLKGAVPK